MVRHIAINNVKSTVSYHSRIAVLVRSRGKPHIGSTERNDSCVRLGFTASTSCSLSSDVSLFCKRESGSSNHGIPALDSIAALRAEASNQPPPPLYSPMCPTRFPVSIIICDIHKLGAFRTTLCVIPSSEASGVRIWEAAGFPYKTEYVYLDHVPHSLCTLTLKARPSSCKCHCSFFLLFY